MPIYCGVDGVRRNIKKLYTGVNGVRKEMSEMWAAQGGVKKLIYQAVDLSGWDPILNNNSWQLIKQASDEGVASSIWSVGDRKSVTLNGNCGNITFKNQTYYVYILGFNHNASLEGENRIHFQFGYTALSGGTHVAFSSNSEKDNNFCMNPSGTNSGGWQKSFMRNTICSEFKNCLPSDLGVIIKSTTKYSDNTGGTSSVASRVTPTSDYIFILSAFEVLGTVGISNNAEKNYQNQYLYYKNGNSRVRYKHDSVDAPIRWWLRSVRRNYTTYFCAVGTGTDNVDYSAPSDWVLGFAPAFCI